MVRLLSLLTLGSLILAAQDAREIIRRSVQLDQRNNELVRNYTFLQRQLERQFDGAGKVKDEKLRTWDVTMQEGSPYRRLVARNDQPISAEEQQNEQAKLRRSIEDRRKETPAQHEHRIADWERRQQRQREPLKELPDAFDFRMVGEESLNGGEAYIIDATPKPGYKPKSASTSYLPKMKARFWIDKKDYQWIKMEAETLDTVTFGAFLIRVAKGAHISMEQQRVNNEVWLPKRIALQGSARLLLVKGLHMQIDITYSDYKKFQTDSRVVATGEAR
jgi:hypothetical protein